MKIKCTSCGHVETTDKDFFVKLIGGAMPVGGFWAWTTYLFAGTGFAMAIVLAIIGGGVAMLIYKDEIVEWIINNDYKCPDCGQVEWKADIEEETSITTPKAVKTKNIKLEHYPESKEEIGALLKSLLEDEPIEWFETSESTEDIQKRVTIAEALLGAKGCEFDTDETGWVILESSGDLKVINSIEELEQYAISH